MGIFGSSNAPSREFDTKVNESAYGYPVQVVMGTAQVQQQIFWADGFQSKAAPAKGGKGGGKGGEYLYSADVIAGLCAGPILGIGDVWSGQSWLGSPTASESYTISSESSYTYTPTNTSQLYNDLGVAAAITVSEEYADLGALENTILALTDQIPFLNVAYGNTLTTGQYSINPSTGQYNFSSADAGTTVTVNYSFKIEYENQQQQVVVPEGLTVSVGDEGSGSYVYSDEGVTYGVGMENEGTALTKVSGTPTVTGTYATSGTNPMTYKFAEGDVNAVVVLTWQEYDPNVVSAGEPTELNFTLNSGTQGQSPYSYLTSSFPDAAFGYTSLATVLYQPMDLGMSSEIQQNRFEVITADTVGGGIQDCNPVQCVGRVLTDATWGLGVGPVPFPVAAIDNGSAGTWGGPASIPSQRNVGATAYNWCAANSLFISPSINGQDTVASTCSKWLEFSMVAAFVSEGLLKLVPYGEQSCAGNGCTWTAPTEFVVALDDTCFLPQGEGKDPLKLSRTSARDAWNVVQVQWDSRQNQYSPEVTQDSDQGLIEQWGERREEPFDADFCHTVTAAATAANLRLKHNAYERNVYEFSLPFTYSYLELMDVVSISTSSLWSAGLNNLNLGITNLPVRITKIEDDPAKGLQISAEDYVFGVHSATLYNKQLNEATVQPSAFADPGMSEVVMFEASNELTGFAGDQIWIGALGTSANWGSCNVWASLDGSDYGTVPVGTIKLPAKLGELASTLNATESGSPAAYDPDYVDSLVVNLATNCGTMATATTEAADQGVTLCFVDGEYIAYSALTYTGQNQVTMGTYLRRGQMGSTISSHSSGTLFMVLDGSILRYTYPASFRGQTVYFKFQSVNSFGLRAQDLSGLTAVTFEIPGDNPGSIDAETGLLFPQYNTATYQGAYDGTVTYVPGNEVTYDSSYYQCILDSTGNLPTDASFWQLVGSPNTSEFLGAYNALTSYQAGNQVTYDQNYYICILATTGNAPTNATYWQQISNADTFLGAYSSGTAYVPGNQVTYSGSYWMCIAGTTGNAPSTTSSYWTLVGTSAILLGTWSSGTAYVAGNQVLFNGNVYTAILPSTNENPGTATSYWTIVGSQSLASIPPAGSLAKVATTAFTYSATTTSVTISWSNLTVYQVDGTNLPLGSSSQTITGLTAGTTYSVFPFYDGSIVNFVSSSDVSGLQSLAGVSMSGSGEVTTSTTFSTSVTTTKLTVECWCYPTSGSGVLVGTGNGPEIEIGASGGGSYQLSVNGSSGSSGTMFGGTLIANAWNHVVVVFSYGTGSGGSLAVTMYVNGVSSTGQQAASSETGQTWRMGEGYLVSAHLSGILGRTAVYSGTLLTATQVTNHFNTMLSGGAGAYDTLVKGDGATYYWELSDTSGTTAVDSIDSNPGTYGGTYTLNTSEQIGGANGSPAIAWQTAPIQVTMYQFSQGFTPLISGGYSVSTPATGTASGVLPSFFVPGLPSNLVPPI